MSSDLSSNGCINFEYIRDDDRKELLRLLDKCQGTKALVWDSFLIDQFSLIADYTLLKEHDVGPMFPLRPSRLPSSTTQHVIFITRPILSLMDTIATCIRKEEEGSSYTGQEYHIYFVPWKSFLCIQKLEELGVYGSLSNLEEYKLDVITLDSDVVSMECSSSFFDLNVDEDITPLFLASKALVTIQRHYGVIPTIYGKGKHAKKVCNLMQKIMAEEKEPFEDEVTQIDRLLVLDRSTDLITPLLTQLTYEGLIDEVFGIKNTTVMLPPEKFSNMSKSENIPTEKKKVLLTSKDQLYNAIRDCNFNAVGFQLKNKAEELTDKFEERHHIWSNLGEARQFVQKIPQMNQVKASLSSHLNIAELIKEHTECDKFFNTLSTEQELTHGSNVDRINPYIEECIFTKKPLTQVLRLLCLQSICNNGLKPKVYEYYKKEIIQTYGFKHLITLDNLEKCNFLGNTVSSGWNYNVLRKSLRLTVGDVNERDPKDISYVYSGYAPLSIRLAQILSHPGWRSIEEVLRILPGPTISGLQQTNSRKKKFRSNTGLSTNSSSSSTVTLVFFIGGVTYAEISALRFLSSKNDGYEYIVATTSIINGSSLINQLIE